MDAMRELTALLRPAGGGIHTVSSGGLERRQVQQRIYGVTSEAEIDGLWHEALGALPRVRVAVLAVPSDCGAGLVRGAAYGPAGLRAALADRMPDFMARARAVGVVDLGDVAVVPQLLHDEMLSEAQKTATRAALFPALDPTERADLPVAPLSITARVVERCLAINPGLRLMVLGGDHSVAWPVVAALVRARPRPFAILHPDAHTDLLPERLGVRYCFATWAYHANEAIGRSGRLVQVGVRASGRDRAHWESSLGVRQFWASDVRSRGEAASLDDIFAHLGSLGVQDLYLSNDIDATDGALAPATGAPEPAGLSEAFVRALIRRAGRQMSVIGADLVEVAPPIGDPEGARRTVEIGAGYVLESLAALTGSKVFETERGG
jgi:arginase family enzyme